MKKQEVFLLGVMVGTGIGCCLMKKLIASQCEREDKQEVKFDQKPVLDENRMSIEQLTQELERVSNRVKLLQEKMD